jgi:cytochrome c oxidase subunit II
VPVRRKLPIAVLVCALLGVVAAGAAAAGNGGLAPPSPASPNAGRIRDAYWLIAIFTGAVFVVVEAALIVFVIRFRRRGRSRSEEGPQIHGSTRLELIWTVIPVVILAVIASFVFYKLPGIKDVPSASAAQRLDIAVEGRQFYWEFRYPNGVVSLDRLRVPVGEVVTLDVTAPAFDVIHSWWIPRLGGKLDAIPGKMNHTWFRAERPGIYRGQCAELCGLFHATMTARVEAMPRDEFQRWYASEAAAQKAGTSDLGEQTFQGACLKCHNLSGAALYGPSLGGNPLLKDRAGLTRLVQSGGTLMPPVGKGWPDSQLKALLDYTSKLEAPSGG